MDRCLVAFALTLVVLRIAPLQANGQGKVSVIAEPREVKLRELDPLLLKIVIDNRGEGGATFGLHPRDRNGTLHLELKAEGDDFYRPAYTRQSGTVGTVVITNPFVLPSNKKYVVYQVVHIGRNKEPIFPKAGKYQLRVVVALGKKELTSNPVSVEVVRILESEKVAARKFALSTELLETIFVSGDLANLRTVDDLRKAAARLPESEMKRLIGIIIAAFDIRTAKDQAAKDRARSKLNDRKKELSPAAVEAVNWLLLRQYYYSHEWQEFEQLLRRFDPADVIIRSLRERVKKLQQEKK